MKKLLFLLTAIILVTCIAFAQENGNGNGYGFEAEEEAVQEQKERAIELFNMEFFMGFPVHWTNGMHDTEVYSSNLPDYNTLYTIQPDVTVTSNTAFGLAMNFNFTKNFGLTLDADIFFGAKLTGFAQPTSDYNTMFGANAFFGPVIYVVSNEVLRVPIGFGFHMYYFQDQLWIPDFYQASPNATLPTGPLGLWARRSDLQFGPGFMLGVQFHFDRNIYLFSRTSVYIDLMRMHKVKGVLYDGYGDNVAGLPNEDTADDYGTYYGEISHSDMFKQVNWGIKPAIGLGIKF